MQSSVILLLKYIIFLFCVRFNVYGGHNPRNHLSKRTTGNNGPNTGQSVRLIRDGNGDITSGPVGVFVHGAWSYLCADRWDLATASAVCKQLGFIRGAKAITTHNADSFGITNSLVYDIVCPQGAADILNCELNSRNCAGNKIAGVICHENIGCPEGWTAGPAGCYQLSTGYVTNRDFAVKRCALRGGHLVTIENEAENHFLSHAFANTTNGPVLTGGEKVNGTWVWKQVTLHDKTQLGEHDVDAIFSMRLQPARVFKWFPGLNGEQRGPPLRKRDRCLFLNNIFHHPNGSEINGGYYFWEAQICKSTKKTMPSGFKFICEKSRDYVNTNVGCFSHDGSDYRGNATHTDKGVPCIKWTDALDINPTTYPNKGLGDHSFCRNPDRDDRPWCWTSLDGEFGFCTIPRCTVDQNAVLQAERLAKTGIKSESCRKDEFTCSDQSCISSWWQCDMEPDCPGADDELNCDYKIDQFKKTERTTIRFHTIETYVRTTNESCAKLCLSRDTFVCRSFSFARRTRDCRLSDKNSLMIDPHPSRREDYYELSYYLDDCAGMFKCNNGRCIQNDLVCNGKDECKDLTDELNCVNSNPLEVRLVGGTESSGTVEVTYLGQTGVICDDRFDDRDATVICRMLGFEGQSTAVGWSYYGTGNGRFLLDDLRCNGTESSLEQCRHNGWGKHDCFKWQVAGVECSLINDLQVELVGGDEHSGRVELIFDGIRGTICNDHWDNRDARVICRMLGYSDGIAHIDAMFGAGDNSLHILLDDVECSGNEDSIADCARSDWLENDCTHDEDAGVTCFDVDATDNVVTTTISLEQTTSTSTAPSTASTANTHEETTAAIPSLSTSSARPTRKPDIDCYDVASKYRGTIAQTETGHVCQHWSKNSPHKHKYHDDKTFADGSTKAAHNYCRAPDNDTVPWCYTKDRKVRWGYCDVPNCGVFISMQNQNITCGGRPMEAGRYRRDVTDEYENLSNGDDNEHNEDDETEIDTSMYRKMGRIMGGSIADYGMHPWQAGIRTVLSRSRGLHAHKCGATIIDEYWVLSAAHCFRDLRKDRILIRTGDHNNDRRDQFEQEFEAEDIFMHAGYNQRTYDYDIALIKLKPNNNHGIIFNEYVQPACLPSPNTDYEAGKKCHISGWGTTEEDMESENLKSARVPIVDDLTCNRLYKWSITENMVCAGYISGGIDTCSGDSGGPLVCDIDGTYTIMGITSFGEGCAVANAPGVYTRVTEFLSWINKKIAENS